MNTLILLILVIAIPVFLVILFSLVSYNRFVKLRNLIQESWRQVDVELNRRYELIPNLVETVRGYTAHESNTLSDIVRLRNQAALLAGKADGASSQRAEIEGQLSGAVHSLMVSMEAYPELKSNVNFLELQRELVETEDRIANGRRYYNANVRNYNTMVESIPSNIIANFAKFEKAAYFEVTGSEIRQAPEVNFSQLDKNSTPNSANSVGYQPPSSAGQLPDSSSYQQPNPADQLLNPGSYQPPQTSTQPAPGQLKPPAEGGYQPPMPQ